MILDYEKPRALDHPRFRGIAWRRMERVLLWGGVALLAIWAMASARAAIYYRYDDWAFSRSLEGKPAGFGAFIADVASIEFSQEPAKKPGVEPPAAESSSVLLAEEESPDRANWSEDRIHAWERAKKKNIPADGRPFARLEIPRVGLRAMVLPGVSRLTLNRGAGHIPGTPLPWENGNFAVAGHRDGFFRSLEGIKRDDEILLTTVRGSFKYRVRDISIVKPGDTSPLRPTPQQAITLVTCYPFYYVGNAPERFIVRAEIVNGDAVGSSQD